MSTQTVKEIHDKLLSVKPEGASHNTEDCPLCGGTEVLDETKGGSVTEPKTYTEEEVTAKIAEATAESDSKLAELESRMANADRQEQLAQVQATLDATVLELEQVKGEKAANEQFWADAIASKEAEDAAAARKDERITAVREAASFPEEYLVANADRFAAMSDEDFAARVEEWKTIAKPAADGVIPPVTAMTASAESTGRSSAVHALSELRKRGVDPRTLIN